MADAGELRQVCEHWLRRLETDPSDGERATLNWRPKNATRAMIDTGSR
jgi:hypothetical protein